MVNLIFGANCPEFLRILSQELERVQNGEPHEYENLLINFFYELLIKVL